MVSKDFFDAFNVHIVPRVRCKETPYVEYVLMPSKEVIGFQLGGDVVNLAEHKGRVWFSMTFRQWVEANRRATFRDPVLGKPHYVEREDDRGDA